MGDQAGDAAVAVEKWVDPEQAVVDGCGGEDGFRFAGLAVDLGEALQKTGDGAGADGDVVADADVAVAKLTGNNGDAFLRRGVFGPEQIRGEEFAEATVDFADSFLRCGLLGGECAGVDPLLDGDVGGCFALEIALVGVGAEVVVEGAFDVDGVGVAAFDEVGVVAVHRADEVGEGGEEGRGEAAFESG